MSRTLFALAVAALLVPANLLAGVFASGTTACRGDACGCPRPDPADSAPSWSPNCCCATQPAPEPVQLPAAQFKPAQEALGDDGAAPSAAPLHLLPSFDDQVSSRPTEPARASQDPIFLRHRNLRL